jgi:predicted RNA-binding protein with PIN domain
MAGTYFIDGYNVLHTARTLRPLLDTDFEAAREALIERIALICLGGARAVLVFDGQSKARAQHAPHGRPAPGLEVVYAPAHHSADTVIERMVYQEKNRLEVCVVSNDRGLRDLCRGLGALTMEADAFLESGREQRRELKHRLGQSRKDAPAFIEDALDADALAALKQLRDRLK